LGQSIGIDETNKLVFASGKAG